MGLRYSEPASDPSLEGIAIFLSASIPDPARWEGEADPLEVTDAVVSLTRVLLTAGVRIVSAAHPTIAPLLLYVAAELLQRDSRQITIYQSQLFEDVLPTATRRFEEQGIGSVVWTPAVEGDRAEPGAWDASLELMRRQMLNETNPSGAAFIGGMEGIPAELELFFELCPGRPTYPIGRPGGEARGLAERTDSPLRDALLGDSVYPALAREVLKDLRRRQTG